MTKRWGDKRYYSLDYYVKKHCGEKLYKIALNGGMSCPNRDGLLGDRGCIFCSAGGSGDFASSPALSVHEQIVEGKKLVARKYTGGSYIAYFQAYTNTYAPVTYLRPLFMAAIKEPDIKILSIATRPDCLGEEVLSLLSELNKIKPVWVELGLQTIHEGTANFIRRGYPLAVFDRAVDALHKADIDIIVHTILSLPHETREDMQKTITYLNTKPIQGIKLQLLHVLKGTDLEIHYRNGDFTLPTMDEYFSILSGCLTHLREDIVVHRLTGDAPKHLLVAPLWTADKRQVLNKMNHYLKEHDIWQGKEWFPS
ncbi:TIGR01212 family radical SAM protein [Lachnoclostridium sp. An181]|uniref:TIGR01212 family radical SAM protein n=1 Tax=Lachnoclostridium sp. An181 TaxID=1965575 RepID=UPI000B383856|nr:TIGR01212 family radical SAM protein [Lachnoclostridium sp. An181]OUP50665.1 TIGR01212 family radical SAM protein [Lachnoclostridium sp. An181]